jgi:hypothetical protein
VAVAGLLCFALMLLGMKQYFSAKLAVKDIDVESGKKLVAILKIGGEEEKMLFYGASFSKLNNFYKNQASAAKMIEGIIAAIPEGCYLKNLATLDGKISVSGFCPDRAGLINFKDNMEKRAEFKNVDFPPNNWVTQKNIEFSINLESL